MFKPGTRHSRALASLLLVTLVAGVYSCVVLPYTDMVSQNRMEIEQLNALLLRYRSIAEQHAALVAETSQQIARTRAFGSAYLRGPSDALAAAELLTITRSAIERSGGKVSSTGILPGEPKSPRADFHRIGVKVQVDLTFVALAEVLNTLEGGKPYVMIDQLIVHSDAADQPAEPTTDPLVGVAFTAFGIVLDESEAVK